jgi:uncharacterized FlgJ-related protein
MTRTAKLFLAVVLTSLCLGVSAVGTTQSNDARVSQTFEFESYVEILALTESLGYTPEAWSNGSHSVPRLYLTEIPQRWRDQTSLEVSIEEKKQLFFRLLLPAVLSANEMILRDRALAIELISRRGSEDGLSTDEAAWLGRLVKRYGLIASEHDAPDSGALAELLTYHLLPIPASLVMAQAAEESGWGTSRFAAEGNALFGQWAWNGQRIRPMQQRDELGDYGIAAFAAPLQSIVAYMLNLNSHAAYAQLRARRAELLESGSNINGWTLAETLTNYSERGQEYIDTLHTIMHFNDLAATDEAYLDTGPSIFLVPTGLAAN